MKRMLVAVFTLILLSVSAVSAQIVPCPTMPPCPEGQTCPLIDCPPIITPGVFTNPEWLHVDFHRVQVNIASQIASTNVDLQFTNTGSGLAEGTFIFPLPRGAAVDQLTMWVNGVAIEARILSAEEARGIYDAIVRQYRDPALLEYIGSGAIQANVFPIPPGEARRIQIAYSQVLEAENGLIQYVYPLDNNSRQIALMSISVAVTSADPISSVYSPTHSIAINRAGDNLSFTAGFEATNFVANGDFSLYYGLANDEISVSLLTFRQSAAEDGFFMLLVQPPVVVDQARVQPKDVIIVLDQSGSMDGAKWEQARNAAIYVLHNLNAADRFNVILFSTGWRIYGDGLQPPDRVDDAVQWLQSQMPNGGTDINGALTAALEMADPERTTTIVFLTDGLPTEGITDTDDILTNLRTTILPNVRIFTFGVGDDVDTVLLDTIARDFRGSGSYVRPSERVDEEVAALYNRISSPVLTNIALDFGGIRTELHYPTQLPDLFAGTQLTLVGRYRDSGDGQTITLTGTINGMQQTFVYSGLSFRANAGGEPFIARLWATRRIGDLLNQIRLNGENPELVQSVVQLSVRYGIITPYTSFLIDENDILTQSGQEAAAADVAEEARSADASGAAAVSAADDTSNLAAAEAPAAAPTAGGAPSGGTTGNVFRTVNDKTFVLQAGVWIDTAFQPDTMTTTQVVFLSDAYFALLELSPLMGDYLALGERVIVVIDGVAYEIVPG
ncbi:MAG: VWA domain-containing protein [Chloroflexi bacterium]|nr:VWA domain-containing protein [Chloroflexota bacterium]